MPHTPPDLIMAWNQTANGAGLVLGVGGQAARYSRGAGVNRNQYPVPMKIRVRLEDSTAGASAAVAVQTSPDNVTYTTVYTFPASSLTIGALLTANHAKLFTFKSGTMFVRLNMSGLAGGIAPTLYAYGTLGTVGI